MKSRDKYQLAQTYKQVMWLRKHNPPAKEYWDAVCKQVRERDGWICQRCQKRGFVVHHMTYKHLHWEHLFLGDLCVLCPDCHAWVHGKQWHQFGKIPKSEWLWY